LNRLTSLALTLPFILTAFVATYLLWTALSQPGADPIETYQTESDPVEIASPRVVVHLPYHDDVRITESGTIYCDAVPLTLGQQLHTQEMCKKYDLDYPLMLGLMEVESSFDETADSGWAYGLCQIGYINELEMASNGLDIYRTADNIEAGCLILSDLMSRHSLTESLMAYNMGEYGAEEYWLEDIHENEYSKAVLEAAHKWEIRLR